MTREDVNSLAMSSIDNTRCLVLELATGYGKTKLAIDLMNHVCDRVFNEQEAPTSILILVAKTVHKQTWKNEIAKWGGVKSDLITIECYESLKKYSKASFDIVVADEMHHLSSARLAVLKSIAIGEAFIGLSATIGKNLKDYFSCTYNAVFISCGIREAVEDGVLPDPKVFLLPLSLDTSKAIYRTTRFGKPICTTQRGYYNNMSSLIEWYKKKARCSKKMELLWLSQAGKRLKWLSEQKEHVVLNILDMFRNYRTLTLCSSIDQSKRLGKYNINSKNKKSISNLASFNEGSIKHITSVNILNEGVNLYNCRIGIFCNLNSSDILVKQRIGRLLRHKSPIIIVPYYQDTREEELVQKMIENYNPNLIKIIENLKDLKL